MARFGTDQGAARALDGPRTGTGLAAIGGNAGEGQLKFTQFGRVCARTIVACAFIVGCEELTFVPDAGQPKPPAASGSPESQLQPQPQAQRGPFECDLGVLPEDLQRMRAQPYAAGSAPAVVPAPSAGDVTAFANGRLFVLSQRGLLSVIDSTDLDNLVLLSRRELPYTPFKLFARGDTLWVLTTAARAVEPGMSNVGESHAFALDVSDPTAIRERASVTIPGVIDDAQLAGDVLYVVSNEHPGCRDCTVSAPPTVLSALALDDTSATRPRSQVRFGESAQQWTHANVMLLTEKRIYVAGPQWDDGPIGSTIHVVDIAPDGELRPAGQQTVAGAVQYSWQLDERDGVLRVASIDGGSTTDPLIVQTFAVRASDQLEPLGRLALPLALARDPSHELAGRFAGAHAYVAAEGGGTLLAIDLTDPGAPKQVGRVELDGSLFYLEVHGDRLFALGQRDRPASMALLDVSNPAAPALRSQVQLPASPMLGYVNLAPQQLELSPDGRLAVVPYAGYEFAPSWECNGRSAGGVQLISVDGDQLRLRGVARSAGQPRRAILRDDRILSIGNQQVESYATADLDAPQLRSRVTIQHDVTFAVQLADGVIARVTQPEDNIVPQLELVTTEQLDDPSQRLGALSLLDALTTDPTERCQLQFRVQAVSGDDARLYVAFESYQNLPNDMARRLGVLTIDVSDPRAPQSVGEVDWVTSDWFELGAYVDLESLSQANWVWSGSTAIILERSQTDEQRLRVVDLSSAKDPHVELVALPKDRYVQLRIEGEQVIASRYERQSDARVRFFVDRVDISNPRAPRMLSTLNTPGALLSLDPATGRGISYCPHYAALPTASSTCSEPCLDVRGTAQLVELTDDAALQLDESQLPGDATLRAVAHGSSAHFLALSSQDGKASVLAVPFAAERLDLQQVDLTAARLSGALRLSASAEHAFVSSNQRAAWVTFEEGGALELGAPIDLSVPIEQLDVSTRGASVALGIRGAQWVPTPD